MDSYIDKLWDVYKTERDLEKKGEVLVTTPRRGGKTTLLRNLLASYVDQVNKKDILYIAPRRTYSLLGFEPICYDNDMVYGLSPRIILVDEAFYCSNKLLKEVENLRYTDRYIKTIFVGTPRKINYIKNEETQKFETDCYIQQLVDQNKVKVYSYGFKDFSLLYQERLLTQQSSYSQEEWDIEFCGKTIKVFSDTY